jgi:hypothetical protein
MKVALGRVFSQGPDKEGESLLLSCRHFLDAFQNPTLDRHRKFHIFYVINLWLHVKANLQGK